MQYFEDLVVGTRASFGHCLVDRDEVIAFARQFDPQPFHLDEAAAAATHFGRLSASGWHTCAMTMRMLVDNMSAGFERGEEGHAGLGSPGVDEIRWKKPVYPGDTLRVETELTGKTRSRSRPEMGSLTSRICVFNQHDELVLTMNSIGLIRTRYPGGSD